MGLSLLARAVAELGVDRVEQEIRLGNFRLEWRAEARPEQLAPGTTGASSSRADWRHWIALAGRRFGKTRSGAEWVQEEVRARRRLSLALVAPTLNDAWKIMVDGESGLLAVADPDLRPVPIRSRRLLLWPNGVMAEIHTSEEPDRLRGRSLDGYWAEELGFWKYPQATWDMLNIALSRSGPLGDRPRGFTATTPKSIPLLRRLLKDATTDGTDIVLVRGSTYENSANLDPDFLRALLRQYEGTRLGEQELHARLLDDAEGALWKTALIDSLRVDACDRDELRRIVVAIDPAVSTEPDSADTGIIVAGIHPNGHAYVLQDMSGRHTPGETAALAIGAFEEWQADKVIAERNQGGKWVEDVLRGHPRGKTLPIDMVWAARGKFARAEPVAALYEQKRVHHVGRYPLLEEQMTQWEPASSKRSPDRIDALTWALTALMLGETAAGFGEGGKDWKPPRRTF